MAVRGTKKGSKRSFEETLQMPERDHLKRVFSKHWLGWFYIDGTSVSTELLLDRQA